MSLAKSDDGEGELAMDDETFWAKEVAYVSCHEVAYASYRWLPLGSLRDCSFI